MAIDSVAGLLFQIKANPDDAQENIARFRTLLGQDLSAVKSQFSSWAAEVFGSSAEVREAHESVIATIEKEKAAQLANAASAEEAAAIEVASAQRVALAEEELNAKLETVGTGWKSIAAVAAGALIGLGATLFETAKKTAEMGEEFALLHQQLGIPVKELSGLKVMAGELGVNFDMLARGVAQMDRNLSPFATSGATAAKALDAVGVKATDAQGHLRPGIEILADLADKFHKMGASSDRTAAAMSILSRAGFELLPLLNKTGDEIRNAAAHAKEMGMQFDELSAEQAEHFMKSYRDVGYVVKGLGVTIGQEVMPYITAAIQGAADFIASHMQDIQSAVWLVSKAFKAAGFVVKAWFEGLTAIGRGLGGLGTVFYQFGQIVWDALHGRISEAKQDWAALKETASETLDAMLAAYQKTGSGASEAFEALGRAMDAGVKTPAKAAKVVTDALAQSLQRVREEVQSLQDQQAKPVAQIELQYQRQLDAANKEIANYRRLAAQHKLSRKEMEQREQEYTQLVKALAQQRDLKLQALAKQRVDNVAQLDEELRNKIAGSTSETHAQRLAAINREIEAERQKYQKLGALDAAHEQLLLQLRTAMLQKLQDEENKAQQQKEQHFEQGYQRLAQMADQYTQASLTGAAKIQYETDQQIKKIQQLEQALLKEATTEKQRQQVVQQAEAAITAARNKEATQTAQLQQKHNSFVDAWKSNYNDMILAADGFSKNYTKIAHQMLIAINRQMLAHQSAAKGTVAAENEKNIGITASLKSLAIVKAAMEIAEAAAAFARLDFRAGAMHTAAAGLYGVVAAEQIAALFSGSGGSSHAAHAGAHAATTHHASASHAKTAANAKQVAPVVNVHIQGVISADNLATVVSQISSLVQGGSASLAASHVMVNGALVPGGAI